MGAAIAQSIHTAFPNLRIYAVEPNEKRKQWIASHCDFVQLVDDVTGSILASSSSIEKEFSKSKLDKTKMAASVGKSLAEKAVKIGIKNVSFDRSGYLYHGRVKSLADGAREGGLKF